MKPEKLGKSTEVVESNKSEACKIEENNASKEIKQKKAKKSADKECLVNGHDVPKEEKKEEVENGNQETSDDEFLLHEVAFNITVKPPDEDAIEFQVTNAEMMQEVYQTLVDREESSHRTCFNLELDGKPLDLYSDIKSIEGLKENSQIHIVEKPYTARDARLHVRHIREIFRSIESVDALNGAELSSLAFLNTVTQGDITEQRARSESLDCTPPDYILPGCKGRPLTPLQPTSHEKEVPPCVKVLTSSPWNPPPGPRRLQGDLMYLFLVTVEGHRCHITACPKGFYLNQSTEEVFNPAPALPSYLNHSLIDLLSQVSHGFKKNYELLHKRRSALQPLERLPCPYQIYSWTGVELPHTVDALRAEDAFSNKLAYEEHVPGQIRDWNDELQTTRELPRKSLPERLMRERAIFKVHADFVAAAIKGAAAVVEGNVLAINPGEVKREQMFMWNNIFYSLGYDVKDHYAQIGGDAAAHVAPSNDLQGVRVFNALDIEGLHTLGTVVVDYRGVRVTAQSLIPGLLEREQEKCVVYGSVDFGKTVETHESYMKLLEKPANQLKMLKHKVLNEKDEEVELLTSIECKGIIGTDKRPYILDLLRTFPADVNFLDLSSEIEYGPTSKKMGFPIVHKHMCSTLRKELIESFIEHRYLMFLRTAALQIRQNSSHAKNLKKLTCEKEADKNSTSKEVLKESSSNKKELENGVVEDTKIADKVVEKKKKNGDGNNNKKKKGAAAKSEVLNKENEVITNGIGPHDDKSGDDNKNKKPEENGIEATSEKTAEENEESIDKNKENIAVRDYLDDTNKEMFRKAAASVGSLKEFEFCIRFNTDLFSPTVRVVDEGDLDKQKQLIIDACEYLVDVQLPNISVDLCENSCAPLDGPALCDAMHARGVNIRYLGKLAELFQAGPRMQHLLTTSVTELIFRSVKHIYAGYITKVDPASISSGIAHFLNCLVSSSTNPRGELQSNETISKKKKKKGHKSNIPEWAALSPKVLWQQIKEESKSYFGFDLEADSIDSAISKYNVQKVSLLRSFCLRCGIQIKLFDYNFSSRSSELFSSSDILNIFPVYKHCNPRATDALGLFNAGQAKIQQGVLREGCELITEALGLLNSVYGTMHAEIAQCLRMLARLNYIMGHYQDAMSYQQKAVLMSERVNGIDHPHTITEYIHLSLYCFANQQISISLKLLYRARYLLLIVCGENHPQVSLVDSNIGLILYAVGQYNFALRFFEHSLELNKKFCGDKSMKVALSYNLVARTQSCLSDFRSAIKNEKETFTIYMSELGANHEKTKESDDRLKQLTQQAVSMARRGNGGGRVFPPLHILSPSRSSVLELLNLINGILFVQFTSDQIEMARIEIEKHRDSNAMMDINKALNLVSTDEDKGEISSLNNITQENLLSAAIIEAR